jgi:hypothetical protein
MPWQSESQQSSAGIFSGWPAPVSYCQTKGHGNGPVKAKLGTIRGLFRFEGGYLHQDPVF